MSKRLGLWILLLLAAVVAGTVSPARAQARKHPKVYWFIPDGLRAEDEQFKIYEWAEQGELPNLKRLLQEGSAGYSWPVFPGHTPTNYATLLTGALPDVHGIADGTMRVVGYPLKTVARGGFNSLSKLVHPIWYPAESNNYLVSLLSVPGSTPPELKRGYTIRGRWGGWGLDFPAVNFQSEGDRKLLLDMGANRRLFTFGSDLTHFTRAVAPRGWKLNPAVDARSAREVDLTNWGAPLFALIREGYVLFSKDKEHVLCELRAGEWSGWLPVTLHWQMGAAGDVTRVDVPTELKLKVIRLAGRDEFRIRVFYDNLNSYLTSPPELASTMEKALGPMVDFVDNFPPQLIYFNEDKDTFLEEAAQSLDWHRRAVSFLEQRLGSDFVIQSIYTPNQMLTSRWWMPYLDRNSPRYNDVDEATRARLWTEVKRMYKGIDAILGEILKNADQNTYIFFSSDHGAIPLYKEVRLNNLFARKGWLKYRFDRRSGLFQIDWDKSKVVFLQMDNVYVNPKGLGGVYQRGQGPAYEKLRREVVAELEKLADPATGRKILAHVWTWEEAGQVHLPADRIGDLVVANSPGYGWTEDLSSDRALLHSTLKGGYKQAVEPRSSKGMLTPFVAWGPGIKAGYRLAAPIEHIDQYRTILHVLGIEPPPQASGRVLREILKN